MNCEHGGRPRGELRKAIGVAFAATGEPMTWQAVATQLVAERLVQSVGASERKLIRRTVENMTQAGELQACGQSREPGCRRPMTLYRLATDPGAGQDAGMWAALTHAMRP